MQASHLNQKDRAAEPCDCGSRAVTQRSDVPQEVWDYLKLCLADAIGIAFASRHYDFATKSLESLSLLGSAGASTSSGNRTRWR